MNRIATFAFAALATVAGIESAEAQKAGQTQQGQAGNVAEQKGGWSPIGQTPWFSNPAIQKQLNINGEQFNQLNRAHGQAWNTYQNDVMQLDANTTLSAADRAQRMQEFEGNFHKNFITGANELLKNQDQAFAQRFNQMSRQYRSYGAFNDPVVQEKLSLTSDQRQKLNEYNQQWTNRMHDLNGTFSKDPTTASNQFTLMRKQYDERINSALNKQQQLIWQRLIGEPYNFQPGAYFQPGSQPPETTGPSGK
jgi:hypothetical protein